MTPIGTSLRLEAALFQAITAMAVIGCADSDSETAKTSTANSDLVTDKIARGEPLNRSTGSIDRPFVLTGEIWTQFGILVLWDHHQFPGTSMDGEAIRGTPPSREQVKSALPILLKCIQVYPEAFIRRLAIQKIVLSSPLFVGDTDVGGCPDRHGNLFLDLSIDHKHLPIPFHHELFHVVDLRDDESFLDENWSDLNEEGFEYCTPSNGTFDFEILNPSDRPGFLTEYSTWSVYEDKAMFFQFMVLNYEHVEERAFDDPVIECVFRRSRPRIPDDAGRVFRFKPSGHSVDAEQ